MDPPADLLRVQPKSANILIVRLRSIGDVLFTLPAVNCVRQNFPEARISFLTHQNCSPLLRGFEAVNEIIPLDREVYRGKNPARMLQSTWKLLGRLRSRRFTHAIDLHGFGETALLTRWTGAPERWGIVYRKSRGYAYTTRVQRPRDLHPIDANLAVLRGCGLRAQTVQNNFRVPEENVLEAARLLGTLGIGAAERFVFVQPFTSNATKNWPLTNYLPLARQWREAGVKVLFGGGPGDRIRLGPALDNGFPCSAGASLLMSAALAKQSDFVIGGDTGLLHMAVAMQKRVLMLINSTAIMAVPYGHRDWTIAPQPGKGIESISLEEVAEAARRILFGDARTSQAAKVKA
jgi:ADP-heptose:LPS heptosyltransferase